MKKYNLFIAHVELLLCIDLKESSKHASSIVVNNVDTSAQWILLCCLPSLLSISSFPMDSWSSHSDLVLLRT